jgi:Tfp pilus assembly pilus retraction ATPase PilT
MTERHDPHDLDKLVTELNAGAPKTGSAEEQTVRLRSWLEQVVARSASDLAMSLAAVMTQTLMPKIGGGRIPAAELLMVGYGARQQVRKNALQHLNQEITITRKQGSFTLEESLTELVKQGLVDRKDALTRAAHPDELERLLG